VVNVGKTALRGLFEATGEDMVIAESELSVISLKDI
jgi:hypothetical protein